MLSISDSNLQDDLASEDCVSEDAGLPPGPSSVEELFAWHVKYSAKLLGTAEEPNMTNIRRCCEFLSCALEIHEQFSGVGTAAWSLHLAVRGMRQHMQSLAGGCLLYFVLLVDCSKAQTLRGLRDIP